jgi:hypothetical protein
LSPRKFRREIKKFLGDPESNFADPEVLFEICEETAFTEIKENK